MIFRDSQRIALAWFICLVGLTFACAADNEIDTLLGEAQLRVGVRATEICDDETFYRRLSLDLIGRVPNTSELEQFLADHGDRRRNADRANRSTVGTTVLLGRKAPSRCLGAASDSRWIISYIEC